MTIQSNTMRSNNAMGWAKGAQGKVLKSVLSLVLFASVISVCFIGNFPRQLLLNFNGKVK